jgi:hypothetical protein
VSWRYLATNLNGDGTEEIIVAELPLAGVQVTKSLSAPDDLQATIPVEIAHLKDDNGLPVFIPWKTVIYAIKDDVVRAACIVTNMPMEDGQLRIEATGFAGYMYDQPYEGEQEWIQADPLVIARHIWAHIQSFENGDIGLVLDETTSPVRVGTQTTDVDFETGEGNQVSFEAGPYKLNWWTHHNLGQEFDNLAEATPFDYSEEHALEGETFTHKLRLGYPTLGRIRNDLRFVVGENVTLTPTIEIDGDEYASHVRVLGSGEGRTMITAVAEANAPLGLRRVSVITDKAAQSVPRAKAVADAELRLRLGKEDVTSIQVNNHPNAPVGAWEVGDQILIQGSGKGWGGGFYMWVRVLDYTISTETDTATLTVTRVERTI